MLLVAIETATDSAGVALADEGGIVASLNLGRLRRHSETVVPGIAQLIRLAARSISEVEAIAVDCGPGLFTGLRVGLAAAKGLCMSLGVLAIPVSSLEILAWQAVWSVGACPPNPPNPPNPPLVSADTGPWSLDGWTIVSTVDAKRGEIFWSGYGTGKTGLMDAIGLPAGPSVSPPDELAKMVREGRHPVLLVGGGALRYGEHFRGLPGVHIAIAAAGPSVECLALLGLERQRCGRTVEGSDLAPIYLREPDATVNQDTWGAPRRDEG